MTNIIDNDH